MESTYYDELPVATGHLRPRRDDKALREEERCVLVVEDDAATREMLVEMLSAWGYTPLPVGSAEEAEWLEKRRPLSAALVDVFLPGRSGTALFTKLRAHHPEAVLIGMSALGDAALARRCKGQGADLFLEKPMDPEALAGALQTQPRSWH